MNRKIYIQFNTPEIEKNSTNDRLIKSSLKKALVAILTKVIPKANPDFEDKIDQVQNWLLECDIESGIPEREIGLNTEGCVIMKMPYKDNYGYWTDNNLMLEDFKKQFSISEIDKAKFEQNWSSFKIGSI